MHYEQITYAVADHIATVTLNRPEVRNAYTTQMADELGDALRTAGADDDVRVVVLTGAGADFCVGADLSGGSLNVTEGSEGARAAKGAKGAPGAESGPWVEPATRATRPMFNLEKPVIAAVRGAAVGVGSTMVLAADFRLAATDSRFGFVFSRRGIFPEGGSTWFLPRIVGLGVAMDWMVTGRLIPADEALAKGLVSAVHAPEEVIAKAYELAREIVTSTSAVSVAVIRQALLRMSALDSPEAAFDLDSMLIASSASSPDAIEGVRSFLERRTPNFPGRVSADQPDFLPWHAES